MSTLKQDPMYTFAVSRRLCWAFRHLGDYASAAKELDPTGLEGYLKLFSLQSQASSTLQLGDIPSALKLAQQCIHLSENFLYEDVDLCHVFYPSYGIHGLCNLFSGELSEAEEYLQKSARWAAGDLTAQMISGNNLGTAVWMSHGASVEDDKVVDDVAGYWSDAVSEYRTGEKAHTSAASFCGPSGNVTGESMVQMIGTAPSSKSTAGSSTPTSISTPRTLESFLAYCTVLINMHRLYVAGGRKQQASTTLAEALSLLNDAETSSTYEAELASFLTSQISVSSVTGRALCLIAVAQLDAGNAVAAEGLFRSVQSKLKTPWSVCNQHQMVETLDEYARLLSKWDNRESEGVKMKKEANGLRGSMPKFSSVDALALHLDECRWISDMLAEIERQINKFQISP